MSPRTTQLTEAMRQYMLDHGVREEPLLRRLREETSQLATSNMQISPEQGQLLRFLVAATGAKTSIEVGVFTGYSALCVALAMPHDGRILACDVNPNTTAVAKSYFEEAGLSHKFDLRLGPAIPTLEAELEREGDASYDFAFIDADKEHYRQYLELCLKLVRAGGLIAVDNVFWSGRVLDESSEEATTREIRAFNDQVAQDDRVDIVMLPIGDGLTLLRKRA